MYQKSKGKIIIKFSISWFILGIIIIGLAIAFFKNKIFATNTYEKEKQIVAFEKNQNAVDIVQVMLENTNSNKKMVNEKRDVVFTTEYEQNPNLPKDEEQVKQEGKNGKIQVTALQEYQNEEMTGEEIIESTTLEEVITQIIYVGTSEFMKKYNVHIDDNMYLLEAEDLKEEAKDDSNTVVHIPRYLNVTLDRNGIFEQNAEVFYNAEQKYKINGIFLAAIGIHESGWGTSKLASEKYNLFGYMAFDRDPYNSATTFENYENSINTVAEALAKNYLYVNGTKINDDITARGTYFNGTTIQSVNTRYASDQDWYEKVYGYMQYLYNRL